MNDERRSETTRLDAAIAARGLAKSRTSATRLITGGMVSVDGVPVIKPSALVGESSAITVESVDHYVSRAAHKLAAALDAFPLDVRGRVVLDVGASTGGFTQVLLERGAQRVIALDVGHGQLSPTIRSDSRVVVVEGFNIRNLDEESLQGFIPHGTIPDLVVADLSFISLALVFPVFAAALPPETDFVVLIKPQFEVGKGGTREGIVRDSVLRDDAVMGVLWAAWDMGMGTGGVISSPIAGSAGNHEYLAWLSTAVGTNPTEWSEQVTALTKI